MRGLIFAALLLFAGCALEGYTSPEGDWYPSVAAYEEEAVVIIEIIWP